MPTEQHPLSPHTIAAVIRVTPQTIRALVTVVADDFSRWHPAPDAWCVNEVVGHIIEADRRGFDGRVRTILALENPQLQGWDPEEVARQRRDCERDVFELLAELETMREESARLLQQLRPEQLQRAGQHSVVGALRVQDVIHEWVYHDAAHVRQILTNLQQWVWPHMGNAQRFSEIFQADE